MKSDQSIHIHPSAIVDEGADIGHGTRIWHFSHIYSNAKIGTNCSFGQNTMVGQNVLIGDNVKVQNNVSIYEGTIIEDDVFLGPSCVLTNVSNPRSQIVRRLIPEKTLIRRGATIGANATIVCGITLGRYCFIGAGAVVTKEVPDYAMILGVPGTQIGWMSRHGHRLDFDDSNQARCPESDLSYSLDESNGNFTVRCLNVSEEQPLPDSLSVGKRSYRDFS